MENNEVIIEVEKVEVKLLKPLPIIRETLERIGIANRTSKKLFPSCYVKVDGDKSFIAHFKELLKVPRLTETDYKRRNTVIFLLEKWGLISIVDDDIRKEVLANIQTKKIFILSKSQMVEDKWEIQHKYHLKYEGDK